MNYINNINYLYINLILFSYFNLYINLFGYPCAIKHLRSREKSIFLIYDYHINYSSLRYINSNIKTTRYLGYNILEPEKAFLKNLKKMNSYYNFKIDLFWESSENIHKHFIRNDIFDTFLQLPYLKSFIQDLENINLIYVDNWRGMFNYYSDLYGECNKFIRALESLILYTLPTNIDYIEDLADLKSKYKYVIIYNLSNIFKRLKDFYKIHVEPNLDSDFYQSLIFPPKIIEHKTFWSNFNKLFIVDLADYKMLMDILISKSKICILYAGAMHCHKIEKELLNLDFKLIKKRYQDNYLEDYLDKFYQLLEKNYALLDDIYTLSERKNFKAISLFNPLPLSSNNFKMLLSCRLLSN